MSTTKSIILAATGTLVLFYLGYLYSLLPMDIINKFYEIASIVLAVSLAFSLLFSIIKLSGSKKSEPPTDENNKNFTDINNNTI